MRGMTRIQRSLSLLLVLFASQGTAAAAAPESSGAAKKVLPFQDKYAAALAQARAAKLPLFIEAWAPW